MCGIFGAAFVASAYDAAVARRTITALFAFSESRGREAAGIAIDDGGAINIYKQAGSVTEFLARPRLQRLLDESLQATLPGPYVAAVGHSRLATNGSQASDDNNQPVAHKSVVGFHNGIIVNDAALRAKHEALALRGDLDSEVLFALVDAHLARTENPIVAARDTFAEVEGSASIAALLSEYPHLLLATNTGSLFRVWSRSRGVFAFASERFILQRLCEEMPEMFEVESIDQVKAGTGCLIALRDLQAEAFDLAPRYAAPSEPAAQTEHGFAKRPRVEWVDRAKVQKELRRCVRCILPESYPYVDFDEQGVCHYCRTWKKITPKGEEALLRAVEPYRSKDGSPDVILAFSGGRDSSYGLHYVKTVLGMNPVAFTYDWGMVTDLARRNQARMCAKLGVEHIVRSADIVAKRRYVRRNVEAWIKRPELGMVTLFMAGDKEFYSHARELRKETGIRLVIFCTGNMIEDAPYKTGLCGVPQDDHGNILTAMSLRNKLGLLWYYGKNYALNPAYFNESLVDTANAFWQTFVVKDDFLYLFSYLEWREKVIVDTIRNLYDWEIATDTTTTWRIGDGTAAFYNYIYQTMAGFTEDDVMLANMVREGHLTRDEAMERMQEFSKPRWPSIREYAQLIGFSLDEVVSAINAAPRLHDDLG